MPTTSHRSLPYPAGADAPNVPADIQALATALDGVAVDAQGLFSARPAAGNYGKWYYATDTDALYRDNGTVWKQIILSTDATVTNTRTPTDNTVTTVKIVDANVTTAKIADANVTTIKIADGNVTAAKMEAQQAWQNATMVAGGTITGGPIQYYKDSLGFVHLSGGMSFGTAVAAGVTLTTLPAGYRPGTNIWTPVAYDNAGGPSSGTVICKIYSAGQLCPSSGQSFATGQTYSFQSIHFRAEN